MTILAALRDLKRRQIFVGADTLLSINNLKGTHRRKIIQIGKYVVGVTGSLRDIQPLEFRSDIFIDPEDDNIEKHLITRVVPAIQRALQESGSIRSNSGQSGMDSTLLIIYKGEMFELHENFVIVTVHDDYTSLGAGGEVARGALYAGRALRPELASEVILETALRAAAKHCLFVNDTEFQYVTHSY